MFIWLLECNRLLQRIKRGCKVGTCDWILEKQYYTRVNLNSYIIMCYLLNDENPNTSFIGVFKEIIAHLAPLVDDGIWIGVTRNDTITRLCTWMELQQLATIIILLKNTLWWMEKVATASTFPAHLDMSPWIAPARTAVTLTDLSVKVPLTDLSLFEYVLYLYLKV